MATCPLCERFSGTPDSVEAHISGSNDDNHEGKVGREFREQIREKASAVIGQSDSANTEDRDDGDDSANGTVELSETSPSSVSMPEEDSGKVESAKLEEDEDGGLSLSLVATGALAYILWAYLVDNQNGNTWETSNTVGYGDRFN